MSQLTPKCFWCENMRNEATVSSPTQTGLYFFKQHDKFSGCPNLGRSPSEEKEKTTAGKADCLAAKAGVQQISPATPSHHQDFRQCFLCMRLPPDQSPWNIIWEHIIHTIVSWKHSFATESSLDSVSLPCCWYHLQRTYSYELSCNWGLLHSSITRCHNYHPDNTKAIWTKYSPNPPRTFTLKQFTLGSVFNLQFLFFFFLQIKLWCPIQTSF